MKQIESIPNPSSLMESMREIGYSTDSSVADIIDNSITAKAKSIHIRYSWNNGKPWIAIIDDGLGMNHKTLINAMKMGSANPTDERDADDLGRFGLGMKTASLSQSRRFTVLTKNQDDYSVAQWDLDDLKENTDNKWMMNLYTMGEIEKNLKGLDHQYLSKKNNGTIVFWDNIDRIDIGDNPRNQESKFNEVMMGVRSHLELVFHRYLSPMVGKTKISILINEDVLDPFDPFFSNKSEEMPYQEFLYGNSSVKVQPFVLPHHSRVTKEEYKRYEGKRGYLQEQGFYIYRNRRLIIYANWFRLIPKAEITKLLRVKIDIPNSLDHLWKIDVKKSNAIPPVGVKEELKKIVGKIEIAGIKVFKKKGKRLISNIKEPAWERFIKENQIEYRINRQHRLIKNHLKDLNKNQKKYTENLFSTLESSFPRDMYFSDIASEPENISSASLSLEQIEELLAIYIDPNGKKPTKEKLKDILRADPFASNAELTLVVFEKLNYEY
jgi:hypothetical protein